MGDRSRRPSSFKATMKLILLLPFCFLAAIATLPAAEPAAKAKAKAKRAPDPAYAKIDDVPGLPRVLLIGDSISIGYTIPVRELLKGKANVHRIPTNGGPTTNGLKNLAAWLGDSKWDVIHFNWGLHDLKYIAEDPSKRANPKAPGSHLQVPLAEYEKNLAALVAQLKATGAILIWCNTTPVPEGSDGRVAGDEVKYNEASARVMKAAGIPTDDLCAHANAKLKEVQLPANVHYTPDGYKYLAEKVAAEIGKALPKK
jgi:lysophospholipase L1-like esterase